MLLRRRNNIGVDYMEITDYSSSVQRVGYSYVPIQRLGEVYNCDEALKNGTLFPELNMPLGVYGKNALGGCNYGRD